MSDERRKLELSPAQIIGGALAAASAAVASSWLGLAGTVIGAVIVSLVASIGGALYTHSLRRSTTVIRQTLPVVPMRSLRSGRADLSGATAVLPAVSPRRGARAATGRQQAAGTSRHRLARRRSLGGRQSRPRCGRADRFRARGRQVGLVVGRWWWRQHSYDRRDREGRRHELVDRPGPWLGRRVDRPTRPRHPDRPRRRPPHHRHDAQPGAARRLRPPRRPTPSPTSPTP